MDQRIEKKEQLVPYPHDFHKLPWDRNTIKLIDGYVRGFLGSNFHHWYYYHGLSKDQDRAAACASRTGELLLVKYLVSEGADITANNNLAVRSAASYGNLDVVRYLVSVGADITACDNGAVCFAASYGHLDVVRYLVSQGADITTHNNFAVRRAAQNGHSDVVKYLVSQGAPSPETL